MKGRLSDLPRRRLTTLAATVVMLVVAGGALAYFTSTGEGTAAASVGTLNAPSNVPAQQAGSGVNVSWSAATLSSGAAVQGYQVTRSDGNTVCGRPTPVTTLSCTDSGVPAGSYTYTVTAVYNGFTAQASSASITILSTPTITAKPSDPSANASPSVTFSGGGGSGYQCQLDGGSFTACSTPDALSGLADGSHTLKVRAAGTGGSSGPAASYTWTIDTSAPAITARAANPSNNASPSFSFTHTESAYTFKCQLDSGGYSACTSPQTYSGLADGPHTFQVDGIDPDGASTSAASYTWSIDTTAPVTSITISPSSPNGSNGWYTSAPSFTLSASDAGGSGVASTSYRIDNGATQTYSGAVTIPDGQHTVTYWSTDNAGNTETHHTTAAINVDTTTPTTSVALAGTLVWGNDGSSGIGRANLDGTVANQSFVAGANDPYGVAVDGSHVLWANHGAGTIGRANLDGTGANQNFITGASSPSAVAVDGSHVYWTNAGANTIGRANLDGTGANQNFITGANVPTGVTVDALHVYWTNAGADTIGRANLDGIGANQNFITGANNPYGVAVDNAYVYWANANTGTIGRANLTDGSPAPAPGQSGSTFITGANIPVGVALDGSHVLWANLGAGTIGQANLNGTGTPNETFVTGASTPRGVAVVRRPASAFVSGNTVYYNGAAAGSFNLIDTVSDSGSGPASASFPGIATTGWTHGAETVSALAGGPYTSSTFSWSANPSNPTGYTITSSDVAGNTTTTPLSFVSDTTAPTGGALSVNGTAATGAGSTSNTTDAGFPIDSRTDDTDSQSGPASSILTVQSETLSGTTCGAPGSGGPFTTPTTITGTTQPSGITAGSCYLYTLTATDNVGNSASINTTVQLTLGQTAQHGDGDGNDGAVTVSGSVNLSTENLTAGRTCADGGDAVDYALADNAPAGSSTLTLSESPSPGCLQAGDEVLIMDMQGGDANDASGVGTYETASIDAVSGAALTLQSPLANSYNTVDGSGHPEAVMVQRVPNYTDVTIDSGATLATSPFDGSTGGALFFRATGTVTIDGTIEADGLGYSGGRATAPSGSDVPANTGAGAIPAVDQQNAANHQGGGGGSSNQTGRNDSTGGGGGSSAGAGGDGANRGVGGPNATGSGGAPSADSLTTLLPGGGGGAGGGVDSGCSSTADALPGGGGGAGGGVIVISANSIVNDGTISADGTDGAQRPLNPNDPNAQGLGDPPCGGGGGGGAGGSVFLSAVSDANLAGGAVTASGGNGGDGVRWGGAAAGGGGGSVLILSGSSTELGADAVMALGGQPGIPVSGGASAGSGSSGAVELWEPTSATHSGTSDPTVSVQPLTG